ncbi:MAG TPA: alpha-E domain-containing protein, partial [Acidisoma sp.]|nr:alpha-E domain-containing protein [Acidisoma sp.]
YFTTLQAGPVLDLVIADDSNPRAVAFQLVTLRQLLRSIGDGGDDRLMAQAEALQRTAQTIVADVVTAQEDAASLAAVPGQLHSLAEGMRALSDLIFRRYFALLPMPRAVGVEQEDEAPLMRGAA